MENEKHNRVVVTLSKNAGMEDTGNLHAYVVDAGGKIIESVPFKGDEAVLNTHRAALEGQTKVYIAQGLPQGIRTSKKNERTLLKMNAYEAVKNFNGSSLNIARIPGSAIAYLPFYNCLITGHVSKVFTIDGQTKKLPLCDMRVHICEVETELRWPHIPIYYRAIPDWVIQEIATKIVNMPPDPIGPLINGKTNLPLRSLGAKRSVTRTAKAPSVKLPEHVMNNLMSGSVTAIRKTMIDYHDLIYPYICLWPIYWPYIYTYDEETIVTTDCNGHFEMWENTFLEDGPLNIYIWIEAYINGQWVTVYRPSLPCHTWWNYACNTDINITLTDPRVTPCNCGTDGPADAVWFRSIGQNASAFHIEQNLGSVANIQGLNIANAGCTDILGIPVSPFGGNLDFKIFCGANIFASGATHYRWQYTKVADENANPIPPAFQTAKTIGGNVSRPYLVKLSATHYQTKYAVLGPIMDGTEIAYHIPHQNISSELSAVIPTADQALSPTWEDIFFDSAAIDSHGLSDGVYRLDLILLNQDAGGHFHVVPVPRTTFQVSQAGSILDSQDAPDQYLLPHNPFLPAHSLSFIIRVDNGPCEAKIHDAELINPSGPNSLSGPCGFIHYADTAQNVQISFTASQPRNFATFSFGITKGNGSQPTGIAISGAIAGNDVSLVSGVPGVTGTFAETGGEYSDNFTVATLLNGCPGQAAFAENLYVASLATDGTYRLTGFNYQDPITLENYYYDPSSVSAFALSNS